MSFRLFFSCADDISFSESNGGGVVFNGYGSVPPRPRPQSIVIAGESLACKSSMLLQYAYSAAIRGFPSLYFKKRSDSSSSLFCISGPDDSLHEEALERICFKYVDDTSQIRSDFFLNFETFCSETNFFFWCYREILAGIHSVNSKLEISSILCISTIRA